MVRIKTGTHDNMCLLQWGCRIGALHYRRVAQPEKYEFTIINSVCKKIPYFGVFDKKMSMTGL